MILLVNVLFLIIVFCFYKAAEGIITDWEFMTADDWFMLGCMLAFLTMVIASGKKKVPDEKCPVK